jgi:hypothetical protein
VCKPVIVMLVISNIESFPARISLTARIIFVSSYFNNSVVLHMCFKATILTTKHAARFFPVAQFDPPLSSII